LCGEHYLGEYELLKYYINILLEIMFE